MTKETSLTTINELSDSAKALAVFSQTDYNQFGLQSFESVGELKSLFKQSCAAHLKRGIQMGFYAKALKDSLTHGVFLDALAAQGLHERTAQLYMKVAKTVLELGGNTKLISYLEEDTKPTSCLEANTKPTSYLEEDTKPTSYLENEGETVQSRNEYAFNNFIKQSVTKQIELSNAGTKVIKGMCDSDWEKLEKGTVIVAKEVIYGIKNAQNKNNRYNIIENKYLKSKEEKEKLKHKLEIAQGKRVNIDPTLFYYSKQSTLLVEDATQAALGFEGLLHEFNSYTDPGKNKIWEAVAVDIFMSCQGALSNMLTSFNRLKALIPQEFQTEQSARLNAFTEEMINQMRYELDVHRNALVTKKVNREIEVRDMVKNKGK